jgi:branched-chain amino acid transport system ATP-binding protein
MSQVLLKLEQLEVNYGAVRALKNVSLEVRRGEVVALLGANGAGKSTTLRAISGLVKAKAGSISYADQSITKFNPTQIVALGVSHCPEGRRVFPTMTVLENLRLGASQRSDRDQIAGDFEGMFKLFPILRDRKSQTAGTLSGGEQQMLALARALMNRPKMLLLDEPSLGIAPLVIRQIFSNLKELKSQGTTILLVEQNVNLALELADRAYVLRTGEIVLQGAASELRANQEQVAQAYLGGDSSLSKNQSRTP